MKKYPNIWFWVVWAGLLFFNLYAVIKTVSFSTTFSDYSLALSFLERITGIFLFTLLFIQIILGAYMNQLINRFGEWIFKLHTLQGPFIYLIVLIHPLFLLIFNYKVFHSIDPFYIYTQVCLLCKNSLEFLYTFGRLGVWLLTIAIFAALLRKSGVWFKENWRKLHRLNYLVFFLVAIHGYFVGGDFKTRPLIYVFFTLVITIFTTVILKFLKGLKNKIDIIN